MLNKEWLLRRSKKGARFVRGIRRGKKSQLIVGIPAGITRDLLNGVCQEERGESLASVAYTHLSGWKEAGSFRLHLSMNSGRKWTLIYKNALYHLDQIPALVQLPLKPGIPEYLVYANTSGPLAAYLPRVFYWREVTPNLQYQYLMEDLDQAYRRVSEPEDRLRVVEEMTAIHQALAEWLPAIDPSRLLQYDTLFAERLLPYAQTSLDTYVQHVPDTSVQQLLQRWPEIVDVYNAGMVYTRGANIPIHGDSNPANILIHRKNGTQLKLIDWEWAGIGLAHADLASLLKRVPEDIEQKALRIYAMRNTELTAAEHRHIYEWSQLQRGLLDAGFVAAQQMETAHDTRVNLSRYTAKSARRTLLACDRLRS